MDNMIFLLLAVIVILLLAILAEGLYIIAFTANMSQHKKSAEAAPVSCISEETEEEAEKREIAKRRLKNFLNYNGVANDD